MQHRLKNLVILILISIIMMVSLLSNAATPAENPKSKVIVTAPWGYTGNLAPNRWADLSPDFAACAVGKRQSPILINSYTTTTTNPLQISYIPEPFILVRNATSEFEIGDRTFVVYDAHTVQLDFPPSEKPEIFNWNGKEYRLIHLHMHSPSENSVNSQNYPLEFHFVNQGPQGKLVILAVFAKEGLANPALQTIIDNLSKEQKSKADATPVTNIDLMNLMPNNMSYYSFDGSLTMPPCTEGVEWIVMANPIEASAEQIITLKAAVGSDNARPLQDLHGRKIIYHEVK